MTILELMKSLEGLPIATAVRESTWIFPVVETVHVLALVLVVGSISMLDLRLLGISSRRSGAKQLAEEILPWTWISFAVAIVTGALMFSSKAATYYGNLPFRIKMTLLLFAGINMALFHILTYRKVSQWNHQLSPPRMAKLAGGLSLIFWMGIVVCGRWIGFTT